MKLTPEKLTAFCAALSETCNVTRACKAVGISRMTAYEWREEDEVFAARWDRALKAGVLGLEDEAHRRGFEGTEEPLTHQGQFTYLYERDAEGQVVFDEWEEGEGENVVKHRRPRLLLDDEGNPRVATVRKYSDTLAIFLLKAHNPDKYRENSKVELSGHLSMSEMTEDQIREELAQLANAGVIPLSLADQSEPDDGSDLV